MLFSSKDNAEQGLFSQMQPLQKTNVKGLSELNYARGASAPCCSVRSLNKGVMYALAARPDIKATRHHQENCAVIVSCNSCNCRHDHGEGWFIYSFISKIIAHNSLILITNHHNYCLLDKM